MTPSTTRRALLGALATGMVPRAGAVDHDDPVVVPIVFGDATVEVIFAPGFSAALRQDAQAWVQRAVAAVGGYFGRFPLPRAMSVF